MSALRAVGLLAALQLALLGVYAAVEAGREAPAPFPVEALDEPAPPLRAARGDHEVGPPSAPHLVHFWATWCAPCVAELPALVDAAAAEGVPLVAITAEPWAEVERFFDGRVPPAVLRDPTGEATARWRVSGLPDTFVVRDGRVVGRVGGPRAWDRPEARAFLRRVRRTP